LKKWSMRTILFTLLIFSFMLPHGQADAAPVLKTGAVNGDVWDLQYRLQLLGYYRSDIDGIFGLRTKKAVAAFQRNYGLPVDGIAGASTWRMLKKVSVNARELTMLARLVHGEARGEPYVGKVAVAAVVMNRLQTKGFPKTVKGTIFQPGAFVAVNDGQYWLKPDKTAYRAAWEAARGWDPTGNALFYFNPRTATSKWIWSRPQIKRIGQHIFTK
jgi:N-acetylmuramoyl-L-alanine amidase